MAHRATRTVGKQRKLPLFGVAAALALGIPSAGLAVVGIGSDGNELSADSFEFFTPASVDPELAARLAAKARERGIRFTPAGSNPVVRDRTVTVAVRIDDESAKAISVRSAIDAKPGAGTGIAGL
ncbi:MAG: hypothetical protein AAGE86_15790, partial [Pseudomonadota bacterium]